MSVRAISWVWEHSEAGGTDRLVLLAIADAADDRGLNAWPSVATIASKCNVSSRTVQRAIYALEELGELRVVKQAGGHGAMRADRRPNRYELPKFHGVTERHPEPSDGVTSCQNGVTDCPDGVTPVTQRGDTGVTQPVLDPSLNQNTRERDGFAEFWKRYPRRTDKGHARKAWPKAIQRAAKDGLDLDALLERVDAYAANVEAHDTDKRFIAYPATWLNGDRWNDELVEPERSAEEVGWA